MQQKKGLGRGLESLMPPPIAIAEKKEAGFRTIPIDRIVPNRMQPRTTFDDERIRDLANSIREAGIIQPLIVSPMADGRYELIAGERRLRASRVADLKEVPVVVKTVDETGLLALSLIENVQREDLNPLEESRAYQELVGQFRLTQEDVAKKVGKSRTAVANSLRLLKLPRVMQEDVAAGKYSAGHARAVLSTESIHEQLRLREWIVRTMPTVRHVERKVSDLRTSPKKKDTINVPPQMASITQKMRESLGTKVKVFANKKGGGKILIDYYSWQDLDRIYRQITTP